MSKLLAPLTRPETYLALAYYFIGAALGSLGLAVLIVGWSLTLCFAITPLVFPLLFGLRWAVGLKARVQAEVANGLLGTTISSPPMETTRGASFWARSLNTVRDRAFWQQQAHLLVSWAIALVPMALLSNAVQLLTLPIWYRWVSGADIFGAHVDAFAETLPLFAVGVVLLVLTVYVAGWLARPSRWLANRLLGGEATGPMRTRAEIRAQRFRALTILAVSATTVVATLVVVYAATTPDGYFWPIWPLLALALVVGVPGWIIAVLENEDIPRIALGSKALAIQVGVSAILLGFLVAVWAITTGGYFWPMWVALGLALLAFLHGAVVYGRRVHQVERLEESRAAAVDVQESELRRIERDLHDGAQARLVALGMSLGMAEEKMQTDPEGARVLLAEARSGAKEALEELRDLARGIRPPILEDRGLEAAIASLIARSPISAELSVEDAQRHNPAVETAAYFVAAEALANAIKHSGASRVDIRVRRMEDTLVIEVVDDGRGGADVSGNGLTGLRQRVAALDGTLRVASPDGGPTIVRAEVPCE